MLEKLLAEAKARKENAENPLVEAAEQGDATPLKKFVIGTYNAISPWGLRSFSDKYRIAKMEDFAPDTSLDPEEQGPHALLLRSYKLGSKDVPSSIRAVARCGAGVNNIDVEALTNRGIPVFNTPGANANAVKELVVCSLFLASRGVVQGINHVQNMVPEENMNFDSIKKRIEKDKKQFGGTELYGKKLGVIGLGHIGAAVADAAIALGMDVIGYDPTLGVDAAWRLPGHILQRADSLEELVTSVDYLTLHVPYMKETHHLIDHTLLRLMKPECHLINFARGELVDTLEIKTMCEEGKRTGMYVADFADEHIWDSDRSIILPHLGASTEEAESNSAQMAANQVMDFIETGSIRNSVNFPTMELPKPRDGEARLCIVNRNVPGMLGLITTTLGSMGLNISQHINNSKGVLAYNAVDLERMPETPVVLEVQKRIAELDGVISSRVIQSKPEPAFFLVNDAELV